MSDQANDRRTAFLGGGKMAEALISGLIRSGGRTADEIIVTCRRDERARELADAYGLFTRSDRAPVDPRRIQDLVGTISGHDLISARFQIAEALVEHVAGDQ